MKKRAIDVESVFCITLLFVIILIPTIVFCFVINKIGIYIFLSIILLIYIISIIMIIKFSCKTLFFYDKYLFIKTGRIEKKLFYQDIASIYYEDGLDSLVLLKPFTISISYFENEKKIWLEMFARKKEYLKIKEIINKSK